MTTAAAPASPASTRPGVTYRLEPVTAVEAARWDEITAGYESRELFHSRAWLGYLAASRGVRVRCWAIQQDDAVVGYFCGGLLRMGPFRILGSPLKSWATNVMGPLVNGDLDQPAFLAALEALARDQRLSMIELEHPLLSEALLSAAGFIPSRDWTYVVSLTPGNEGPMWAALDSTCRNRIRKALRSGLTVEDADDPAVADQYYDLYLALMSRKRAPAPFPREHARLLFTHLKPADRLFALRVKDPSGQVLAVGLFPHDDGTMYFWSGASRAESHTLCPNDLLHWRAMCLAAELGLHRYNMSGHGRFKRKFGGVLTPVTRWHKCYSWPARVARSAYGLWSHESPRLYSRWIRATEVFTPDRTPVGDGGSANWAGPWPRPRDQRPALRLSDIWRAPLHDFPIRDEILYQYLPLTADTHVLEVGPGNGITAFHVARRVRHLTLLDVASGNVDRLKSALDLLPNVTFVCADICAPGLSDILPERFDAIYALEVFDLLPEPERCLANLAALLRPGGHLLLQFPNYPPSLSPGPTHYGSRQELGDALAAAGFTEWAIYALRLRPYAGALYSRLHELPLRLYRQHHARSARPKALVYDDSWAFQHGHRLERFKPAIHAAWSALAAAMRLGGDVFTQVPLGQDIMNRNLLLVARR